MSICYGPYYKNWSWFPSDMTSKYQKIRKVNKNYSFLYLQWKVRPDPPHSVKREIVAD